MDNKETVNTSGPKSLRPTKRRLVQLYAALLYNAHVKGFIKGEIYTGNTKAMCVPGFNCYSCPAAVGACPLGSLQNALASSGNRTGFYVFGIIMLWGLMLGRTICGWICPLGLIQELLHKIPTPKIKKSRVTYYLSYLKYFFLVVFAIAIPLWYGLKQGMTVPGFCKYICPAGTLEGGIPLMLADRQLRSLAGALFSWKMLILIVVLIGAVLIPRFFCRYLCPLGALYGLFNRYSFYQLNLDQNRCTGCHTCAQVCPMAVEIPTAGDKLVQISSTECIRCGRCKAACPAGAIRVKGLRNEALYRN